MTAAAELIKELSEEKTRLVNENVLLKREVESLEIKLEAVQSIIRDFSMGDAQDMEDTVASVAADNKRDTIRKYR